MYDERLANSPTIKIVLTKHGKTAKPERKASRFRLPGSEVQGIAQVVGCEKNHGTDCSGCITRVPRKLESIAWQEDDRLDIETHRISYAVAPQESVHLRVRRHGSTIENFKLGLASTAGSEAPISWDDGQDRSHSTLEETAASVYLEGRICQPAKTRSPPGADRHQRPGVLLCGSSGGCRLTGRRMATRPDPGVKIILENADSAFRNLDFGGTSSFCEQPLQRAPDDTCSEGCLVEREDLHRGRLRRCVSPICASKSPAHGPIDWAAL